MLQIKEKDLVFEEVELSSPPQVTIKYNKKIVASFTETEVDFSLSLFNENNICDRAVILYDRESIVHEVLKWLRKPVLTITHTSDTHGNFPKLPPSDLIIHSGDLLPNETRGIVEHEVRFQTDWIKKRLATFKQWIGNRPFLFCMGNHDFMSPVPLLVGAGINAIDITNAAYEYKGVRFYGFPYIPYIDGEWNFEKTSEEMHREIRRLKDVLVEGVDVLVCHAPPHGILDSNFVIRHGSIVVDNYGERCGNNHLTDLLSYGLDGVVPKEDRPKYLLTGHIHEHHLIIEELDMTVSNAATTVHTIEVKL